MIAIGLSTKGHWGFAEKERELEERESVERDECIYATV